MTFSPESPRLIDMPGPDEPVPFLVTRDMFGGLPFELGGVPSATRPARPAPAPTSTTGRLRPRQVPSGHR